MKRLAILLVLSFALVAHGRQKNDPKNDQKNDAKNDPKNDRHDKAADKPTDPKAEPKPESKGEAAGSEATSPSPDEPAASAPGDLDALRKEYEAIRESLFTSRARAAAVGDAVYSARIQVQLRYAAGRFQTIRRATVRLDGANVYDDTTGAVTTDEAPRFEGFVAPGTHVVTIRLEAQAKDDDRFVTTTEDSFTVDAVAGRLVVVKGRADDGGDMAFAWKKKQKGSYKLRLDVNVETKAK